MRIRLVLIAVAFAVLAFAGVRGADPRAIEPVPLGPVGNGAACVVFAQPPADVDPPAIVRAAVTTPAAPQTHLDIESSRHTRLVNDTGTVVRQARPQLDHRVTSPRTFPLLI